MTKRTYYARVAGFINGAQRQKGESVGRLTDREAKWLVMSGLVSDKPLAPAQRAERAEQPPASKKSR